MLGVSARALLDPPPPRPDAFDLDLPGSTITLITGASGAGKSALLRDIAHAARAAGRPVVAQTARRLPEKPAVDLLANDTPAAMRALAQVGLAEAACFVRRPSELSEGQRWRLHLAIDLHRAERRGTPALPALLIADEFAATLDPDTAASVAHLLRRAADRSDRVALVLATPRDDLRAPLAPDRRIECAPGSALRIEQEPQRRGDERPAIRIAPGRRADLAELAPFHYRADAPATIVRILSARDARSERLAGVLTISMPTLNASWRDLAWPGRYTARSRRENIRRVNRELRCISRVIVAPAFRNLGVARALVAHYLARPDTPCTEALAAMGRVCPFFRRAGMTPYFTPPTRRDARLLDALAHAGLEPWRLALPDQALARAIDATSADFIERETRLWARASRSSAAHARDDLPALFARASLAVSARPVAYAHSAT